MPRDTTQDAEVRLALAEVNAEIAKLRKLIVLARECDFLDLVSVLRADLDRDIRWRDCIVQALWGEAMSEASPQLTGVCRTFPSLIDPSVN